MKAGIRPLRGAVVAVTGASSGIGRETALAFAREGARIAGCARRLDRLESLAREVEALGGQCLIERVDVAEVSEVQAFVSAILARFSRLDVLVNNAGYGVRGTAEATPVAAYERLHRVNFMGTVYGCQAAIPVMRRQGRGVIVNVSSIVGHRAFPGGAAYGATKAAQVSLTEALRVELAGTGIAVVSVHPIGTETEFGEVAGRESYGSGGGAVGPQQSAATVARAIVRCARRPRPEVFPHHPSRLLVWLNALAPSLVDRLVLRMARRARRL